MSKEYNINSLTAESSHKEDIFTVIRDPKPKSTKKEKRQNDEEILNNLHLDVDDYGELNKNDELKSTKFKKRLISHTCPVVNCGKLFKYKWLLNRHLNAHFCFNFFECKLCMKTFKTEENLKLHILNIHQNVKPYCCSFCEKRFSHRNGKNYHERTRHTNYLPYNCPFEDCEKSFPNKTSLNYHIGTHWKNKKTEFLENAK